MPTTLPAAHRLQAPGSGARRLHQRAECSLPGPEVTGRSPPVVQPVGVHGVLGQVDPRGVRVDRDSLVGVPAQKGQRDRTPVDVRRSADRVDLEHGPVVPGQGAFADHGARLAFGLLAGEPRAPRGHATGTVVVGPREAGVGTEAVAVGVDGDGRRAARGARVVRQPGKRRDLGGLPGTDLVVGDQDRPTVRAGEDAHAVRVAGVGIPVVGRRDVRERDLHVPEAGGETEDSAGIGNQRPITGDSSRNPRNRSGKGFHAADKGESKAGGGAGEQGTTRQ